MKNVYNYSESHKIGAIKIPSECLWHERWPDLEYVGIESVQSSYNVNLCNGHIIVHLKKILVKFI